MLTPFAADSRPTFDDVTTVPGPTGDLGLSPAANHRRIGDGWATWSHGYTGDVYFVSGVSVLLTLPPATGAFYFYAEPNQFGTFTFEAIADDGTTSGPIAVLGSSGAQFFGFYVEEGSDAMIVAISVTTDDSSGFAVGEFGIAELVPEPDAINFERRTARTAPRAIDLSGGAVAARANRERAALPPAAQIVAPSTGIRIAPPNTGDGGLVSHDPESAMGFSSMALVLFGTVAGVGLFGSILFRRVP
jgi:hypothetical protein